MKKLLILCSILVLAACDQKAIDDEKLVNLYVDLVVAREKLIANDSLYVIEKEKIFDEYGVNEDKYFSSLEEIRYDDDRWGEFFKKAKAYIDSLEKRDTIKIIN